MLMNYIYDMIIAAAGAPSNARCAPWGLRVFLSFRGLHEKFSNLGRASESIGIYIYDTFRLLMKKSYQKRFLCPRVPQH